MFKFIDDIFKGNKVKIIPFGFRCFTRIDLKKFNLITETFPFDNGFFTPNSLMSVIKSKSLIFENNFTLCTKKEQGSCIEFYRSTEEEINNLLEDTESLGFTRDGQRLITKNGIQLLDSTYGFFTLHDDHGLVLAHYFYHEKSKSYKRHY